MSNASTASPLTLTLYISFSATDKLQISPSLNSDDLTTVNLATDWLKKLETAISTQRAIQFSTQTDRSALQNATEAARWVQFVMQRYDLKSTMRIFEIPVLPVMGSQNPQSSNGATSFAGCIAIHGEWRGGGHRCR